MATPPRIGPPDLRGLTQRSDRAGLLHLAGHLIMIGLGVGAVHAARHGYLLVPAMAVLGVCEVALFTPLHETTHRTPFRTQALNHVVGWIAGFVLVLPPLGFRCFHLEHHRHTQDPQRDPELIGTDALTRRGYWLRLTGLPYWRGQLGALLATAAGRTGQPWISPTQRLAVVREARAYLCAYALLGAASVTAHSSAALIYWVVPVLLGQPALRWVLMAEHTGRPSGGDSYSNTRTTLTWGAWRHLFWNANYHAEHHLAPAVPFHALPELHTRVRERLCEIEPGYVVAHRRIRAGLAARR